MRNYPAMKDSTRNMLSLALIIVGALVLLAVPLLLVAVAFSGTDQYHLPGTLVIITAVGGMALVVAGGALRA